MTLDEFLAMFENERRRCGVAFFVDSISFAIGTAETPSRSPLEFLADQCHDVGSAGSCDLATLANCFGMAEYLIEQLIVASDGGCSGYLRERLEDACGL